MSRIGGSHLRQSLIQGIGFSRYGVFVISPHFLRKFWPKEELRKFLEMERGENLIVPVWHGVTKEEVEKELPKAISERIALSTKNTKIDDVVKEIVAEVRRRVRH